MAPHFSILAWRLPWIEELVGYSPGAGKKESDTTERRGTSPFRASQVARVIKHLPASAGDTRDLGLIPWSERCPQVGNVNPHQYWCLGNPMDKGAWRATIHGIRVTRVRHDLMTKPPNSVQHHN